MSNQQMVAEFHSAFDLPICQQEPSWPADPDQVALRDRLIEEEAMEACLELRGGRNDVAKLAKELADILYVTYGTAVVFGIPLDEVFAAVHESNMSKLGEDGLPIFREDGKVIKGPNYFEPDIAALLEKYK